MARSGYSIVTQIENDTVVSIVPNAPLSVLKYSDGTLVQIYTEAGAIITQVGATSDVNGTFKFWCEPGNYYVSYAGLEIPITACIDEQTFADSPKGVQVKTLAEAVADTDAATGDYVDISDKGMGRYKYESGVADGDIYLATSTAGVVLASIRDIHTYTQATVMKVPNNAPNDHGLLQATPQAKVFRQHMEPYGNVENGTVSKLDWMLDPYDGYDGIPYADADVSYRIFHIFTKTGNHAGLNGENGVAVIGTKNRGDGNTWGVFTGMHFGFNDGNNVPMKMHYMDTSDTEWRTPMKNFWYPTKPLDALDYVLYELRLYRVQSSGSCGTTPPTHTTGTVSDGNLDFEFIRNYQAHVSDIDSVVTFGDIGSMPRFNHKGKPVQFAKDTLHWANARQTFESAGQQTSFGLVKVGVRTDAEEWQLEFHNNNRFRVAADHYRTSGIVRKFDSLTVTDADVTTGKFNVSGYELVYTNFSAATSITGVTGAIAGQRLMIIALNANTTLVNNGSLKTKSGIDNPLLADTGATFINSNGATRLREV